MTGWRQRAGRERRKAGRSCRCCRTHPATDWDRELERRDHAFCCYADDCNIYARSKAAGERLLMQMTTFLEKRLKLQINESKSACARHWTRKFLGYSLTMCIVRRGCALRPKASNG
ncbi:MAG: reverse transcriptase domain-containing protein [Burkholderia sp.]